jgi:hypothetical protein
MHSKLPPANRPGPSERLPDSDKQRICEWSSAVPERSYPCHIPLVADRSLPNRSGALYGAHFLVAACRRMTWFGVWWQGSPRRPCCLAGREFSPDGGLVTPCVATTAIILICCMPGKWASRRHGAEMIRPSTGSGLRIDMMAAAASPPRQGSRGTMIHSGQLLPYSFSPRLRDRSGCSRSEAGTATHTCLPSPWPSPIGYRPERMSAAS